jgi:hypothetical protein
MIHLRFGIQEVSVFRCVTCNCLGNLITTDDQDDLDNQEA